MKVKMLTIGANKDGTWTIGEVKKVDDKLGSDLVSGGFAVELEEVIENPAYVEPVYREKLNSSENDLIKKALDDKIIKSKGGGWYITTAGEKLHGKDNVIMYLDEIEYEG